MIGILIISHGGFGTSLIQSASHILGKHPPDLQELGVTVRDDPEAVFRQAQALVRAQAALSTTSPAELPRPPPCAARCTHSWPTLTSTSQTSSKRARRTLALALTLAPGLAARPQTPARAAAGAAVASAAAFAWAAT